MLYLSEIPIVTPNCPGGEQPNFYREDIRVFTSGPLRVVATHETPRDSPVLGGRWCPPRWTGKSPPPAVEKNVGKNKEFNVFYDGGNGMIIMIMIIIMIIVIVITITTIHYIYSYM